MKQSTLRVASAPVDDPIAPLVQLFSPLEKEILAALRPLSPDYPGIENWFLTKVIPGIDQGTRKIIRIERDNQLAALGIAKKEEGELKICTVRVMPRFTGRGLGLNVFDALLGWLETNRPHLTVSESRHSSFERILHHYGFKLTSVIRGLYLPGEVEYLYNEPVSLRFSQNRTGPTII
jgi:hypothetical protein